MKKVLLAVFLMAFCLAFLVGIGYSRTALPDDGNPPPPIWVCCTTYPGCVGGGGWEVCSICCDYRVSVPECKCVAPGVASCRCIFR